MIEQNLIREDQPRLIQKEMFNSLLSISENDGEREKLKHAVRSVQNLSKREARRLYGISNLKQRSEKVSESEKNCPKYQMVSCCNVTFREKSLLGRNWG